jgi:hypothetical protein
VSSADGRHLRLKRRAKDSSSGTLGEDHHTIGKGSVLTFEL